MHLVRRPHPTGKTFRETLRAAKALAKEGKLVIGAKWWAKYKAIYAPGGDVDDNTLSLARFHLAKPPEPIFTAFKSMLSSAPDREKMSQWCKGALVASEPEIVVAGHALMGLSVKGAGDQFQVGLDIMRMMARVDIVTRFPDIRKRLHKQWDLFLCEVRTD